MARYFRRRKFCKFTAEGTECLKLAKLCLAALQELRLATSVSSRQLLSARAT